MKLCKQCKKCGKCKKPYSEMSNYAERCKEFEEIKQTNYDCIKAMSVDEMADVILNSNDEICFAKCKAETGNGYSCKFGDNLDISNCKNCMKEWLESDVEGE